MTHLSLVNRSKNFAVETYQQAENNVKGIYHKCEAGYIKHVKPIVVKIESNVNDANHQVEKTFERYLPKVVAHIALNILKALPIAIALVACSYLAPPPIGAVVWISTGISALILTIKMKYNASIPTNALGLANAFFAGESFAYAFMVSNPTLFITGLINSIFAAIFFTEATVNTYDHCHKKIL